MKPLMIGEQDAIELYPSATPIEKRALENTFGKVLFKVRKPFDQILTIDDVFEATGADRSDPKYSTGTPDEIAYHLLKLLPKALNPEQWVPDFNNSDQRKWSPWFYMDSPGFRFFVSYYGSTITLSTGGSRLCYAEESISDHAGKHFLWLYKQWLS